MARYTWPLTPDEQGEVLRFSKEFVDAGWAKDAYDSLRYSLWTFQGEYHPLNQVELEAMLDKEIDLFYRRFPVSPTLVLVPHEWLHLLEGSLNLHVQASPESITYRYREIPLQAHDQPFGVVVIGPV